MEKNYRLIFSGELQAGFTQEDVINNFISLTKIERSKAEQFLQTGKPGLIKKGLDRTTANRYKAAFERAGLKIQLVKSNPVTPQSDIPAQGSRAVKGGGKPQPKSSPPSPPPLDTPAPSAEKPAPQNPYAAPKASLKVEKSTIGGWLERPQKVPAARGWHWVKAAIGLFLAAPWKWLGLGFVTLIIMVPLNLIPFAGPFLNTFFSLLIGGGLMLGAHAQSQGRELTFDYLFKGFSHNRNQLLMVGVYYLGFFVLIGGLMGIVFGGGIFAMFGLGSDPEAAAAAFGQNIPLLLVIMLLGAALSIPLMMAYWFTTPLVALADQTAFSAYKLSFRGCLKNWLAFLVYGLAFLGVGVLLIIALTALSALLAFFLPGEGSFVFAMLPMVLMMLFIFPIMVVCFLSIYTGCRDIFYRDS